MAQGKALGGLYEGRAAAHEQKVIKNVMSQYLLIVERIRLDAVWPWESSAQESLAAT